MGGIAGLFHPATPKPVDPARLRRMLATQAHRGPGGEGVWTAPGVALGCNRPAGVAALRTEASLTVVQDGAILNAEALRRGLEADGVGFESADDAELLLAGWRRWGPALPEHIEGEVALALYDAGRGLLFLSRDRIGAKPLHLAELSDGSIAFASELKGLLAHPLLRRVPDITAVEDFLAYGYVPDDACLVAGVAKLPAAHRLTIARGRPIVGPERWWQWENGPRLKGATADVAGQWGDLLRRSVRSRMIGADGALLSGDADSAAVVALMAEASPRAVRTLGTGPAAEPIARRFATDHVDAPPFEHGPDDAEMLAVLFDEPFADPRAIRDFASADAARDTMAVALLGMGGALAMADGERHRRLVRGERLRALLHIRVRQPLFTRLGAIWPDRDGRTRLEALALEGAEAYARHLAITPRVWRERLFTPAARHALGGHRAEQRYVDAMAAAPASHPLDRALHADLAIALPGQWLARADRSAMAAGLELRLPLLDHRLLQCSARLPIALRRGGGAGRDVLGRALASYLPGDALRQPVEDGWRAPAGDLAAALGGATLLAETGWFDPVALTTMVEAHRGGDADHGATLWQMLVLEQALRRLFP